MRFKKEKEKKGAPVKALREEKTCIYIYIYNTQDKMSVRRQNPFQLHGKKNHEMHSKTLKQDNSSLEQY